VSVEIVPVATGVYDPDPWPVQRAHMIESGRPFEPGIVGAFFLNIYVSRQWTDNLSQKSKFTMQGTHTHPHALF
jgi:hypothetical protein